MSEDNLYEISWGEKNIFKAFEPVRYAKISSIIYTDASLEGWVASMGDVSTGGTWLPDEKLMHINVLELKEILLALKSFVKTSQKHIKVMSDNTTALTKWGHHIHGMSSRSSKNLGMDNYSQKLSFSSPHFRETKHSGWQGI